MFTLLQELLVNHLPNIMAIPLQPRTRTMTAMKVTVSRNFKNPSGTGPVLVQSSMVTIIVGCNHRMLMESTGITGKVTTTLRGELG